MSMEEKIKSVGIDIGTSTTQMIFSELTICNTAGSYVVPRIHIVDKRVVYRSPIYFTPLIGDALIDTEAIEKILRKEYAKAGVAPADLQTGAVIITGDSARKENADIVLQALSDMAKKTSYPKSKYKPLKGSYPGFRFERARRAPGHGQRPRRPRRARP